MREIKAAAQGLILFRFQVESFRFYVEDDKLDTRYYYVWVAKLIKETGRAAKALPWFCHALVLW
jgi:hypothetical protein